MNTFWNKRIKNTSLLAENLQEEEIKIKELKNGDREVKGETMDRVLKNIEENKIKNEIEKAEIYKWYLETDLKKLREDFGYKSQNQLSIVLKLDNSTICNLEKKNYEKVTNAMIKYYNFFKNDFNKNINTKKEAKKISKEYNEIWDWYLKTNMEVLRNQKGFNSQKELAKCLNISNYMVSDFETKKYKKLNNTIKIFYDYYNKHEEIIKEEITNQDDKIWEWYLNTDLKKLIKDFGYKNPSQFRIEQGLGCSSLDNLVNKKFKGINKTIIKMYEFFNNTDGLKENTTIIEEKNNEIAEEEEEENEHIEEPTYTFSDEILKNEFPIIEILQDNDLMNDNIRLKEENERLKRQIERYEKLIDRL